MGSPSVSPHAADNSVSINAFADRQSMSSLPDHGKAEPRASVHPPSIDSSAGFHERPEPRIRAAIRNPGDCGVEDLKEILETEKSRQCHDYVRLLGLSLLASAEVGNIRTAELVLKLGVHPAALSSRQSPLIRAVHRRNFDVVDLLVKYGAQVDQADRHGMTALMIAALENACNLLELLLRRGADVNRKDNEGKTVLHRLAADQSMNWGVDVLDIVLKTQINVDARDTNGRTALHWACVTDNQMVVERLLTQPTSKRADIGMTDSLLRTPLHLAVARGNCDIVPLLLFHGADINAQSAGGWTPLHIACQRAKFLHRDPGIVQMLLDNGAQINAQTTTGETPLHLAAESGVPSVLECLLRCPDVRLNIQDEYRYTPFSKAVKAKSMLALRLIAHSHSERLSKEALDTSKAFKATIVDFGDFPNGKRRTGRTMHDLLYSTAQGRSIHLPPVRGSRVSPNYDRATHFRWIHMPANNIAWAEALLIKAFMEDDDYDFEKFVAVERSLQILQRSQRFESHYMRPFVEPTSDGVVGGKSSTKSRQNGPPLPNQSPRLLEKELLDSPDGSVFILMPYIHFELGSGLQAMERTIRDALVTNTESTQMMLKTSHLYKEDSNRQRLQLSSNDFDIRVLPFYRRVTASDGVVTHNKSDKTQLTKSTGPTDIFLYMVGQLWMWILSDQLIITSLPQQWNLPGDDHLNVLEGIINDIKNRSKETVPVRSVVDLASIISGRCIGTFESRVVKERDYPFLDKFESAVSGTNEQVDELFRQFNSDSWRASEWLKQQRGSSNRFLKTSEEKKVLPDDNYSVEPECVDRLLDINPETKLLDHIQSLRDEFQLLASVLANQSVLISEFVGKIRVSREDTCTLKDYAEKQLAMIRTHSRDIERMQHQTDSIHASITNLLDLKHRYANVFEARFARYQATDTVHQGQTIMVFTIVTVIFLPLSFIGTLFTINISDFPQGNGGEPSMPLAYVSKRVFGIGFAISIPLVILALSYGSVMQFVRERQRRIRERWERKPTATPEIEEADWREIVDGTTGGSAEFNVLSTAKKRRTNAIKEEV